MKGLYIHIPFCNTICSYCDFPKQIAKEEKKALYIDYLINEINSKRHLLNNITSVYIGGGTPNSINIYLLEKLFISIKDILNNSIENTIEINCELLTNEQAILFNKYNINRVSIGVQTIIDRQIKAIKRHHNKEMVINAIQILNNNHIQNINLDMMYGLPFQTISTLNEDIDFVLSLPIKHVSYYSLIKEEKTILEYQLNHNQIEVPDDDLVADMYEIVNQKLKMKMFNHYEISNYAINGYESIHNLLYWNLDEYIGVGASAASFINHQRLKNANMLKYYYLNNLEEEYNLSIFEEKQEYMMLGLRKINGINILDYYNRFKTYPNNDFDINKLVKLDLIVIKDNQIMIKEDKILLANLVFEEFVG